MTKHSCAMWPTGAASLLLLLGGAAGCAGTFPGDDTLPGDPVHDPAHFENTMVPPVSGGTLIITQNNARAVAADPDRDSVWIVDLTKNALQSRVQLSAGSEPGRVVEDQYGKIHVALRRGGSVVAIDPQTGSIISTRPVCAAPRGLAYDATSDNLHVACASGELVTMKASGGGIDRKLILDSDLRDVVVKGDHLLVSRFRSAELLEVDASGAMVGRLKPRTAAAMGTGMPDPNGRPLTSSPTTAWRLLSLPGNEMMMLHQRASDSTISTKPGGYSGQSCMLAGIANTGVTSYARGPGAMATVGSGGIPSLSALAVDVAVSPDGTQLALIGLTDPTMPTVPAVITYDRGSMTPGDGCMFRGPSPGPPTDPAQPTAGAYDGSGNLYVQSRNPALLTKYPGGEVIRFPDAEDRSSEGHRIFHSITKAMIACASCHPEGGDDSHVWTFDQVGSRRTQSLRGGLLATAPFHWDGDMKDLTTLMDQVFTGRMSGLPLDGTQVGAVGEWLNAQPALPKSGARDQAAVERGKTLFNDSAVGCVSCHSGTHYTNNQSADVGTGKSFQVPSLIDLTARAPYLHNGCAATVRDRFDPACGGGDTHGRTSQLASGQIDDLVAYLETL